MRQIVSICAAISFVTFFLPQSPEGPCAKHVESPEYPPISRTAHVQGVIDLIATIDSSGNVVDVTPPLLAPNDTRSLLVSHAVDNIREWKFDPPATAPYILSIAYEYKIDCSLKQTDRPTTKVTMDLPKRVTILTNCTYSTSAQN